MNINKRNQGKKKWREGKKRREGKERQKESSWKKGFWFAFSGTMRCREMIID